MSLIPPDILDQPGKRKREVNVERFAALGMLSLQIAPLAKVCRRTTNGVLI